MILLDTSVVVALIDERDAYRGAVMKALSRLPARATRQDFWLCTPVLAESLFFLEELYLRQRLEKWLEDFHVRRIDLGGNMSDWSSIWKFVTKYSEHEPDFADAYLVALADEHRKAKVWTFDSEFKTVWRRADGSKIPLV